MNLHEYQSKQLLRSVGLNTPCGILFHSLEDIKAWLNEVKRNVNKEKWVAKCQIHAGGRGLVGAVRLMECEQDVLHFAAKWLGTRCVTHQTTGCGLPVNILLIEPEIKSKQAFYLSIMVDRRTQTLIVLASTQAGSHIEETGDTLVKIEVNLLKSSFLPLGYQLAEKLAIVDLDIQKSFANVVIKLIDVVLKNDLILAEINPLICTNDNRFVCLDAKTVIDDNALFRHPELLKWRDVTQEDMEEYRASEQGFSYVRLSGNIGCMVNGAGLAMATLDTIALYGGKPANFLDVGGATTKTRIVQALQLILSDAHVNGILVNIFGGIVCCDLIAEGLIAVLKSTKLNLPLVVRFEGNGKKRATQLLLKSGLTIVIAENLEDAVQKILFLVKK